MIMMIMIMIYRYYDDDTDNDGAEYGMMRRRWRILAVASPGLTLAMPRLWEQAAREGGARREVK